MKRLLFIFFVFSCFFALGQKTYTSYQVQFGTYSSYDNEWYFGEAIQSKITFTISGNFIACNDLAFSTYRLVGSSKKDFNVPDVEGTSWEALDEKNRKCLFVVYTYKNTQMIYYIKYENKSFRYYIGKQGLSNYY